MEDDWDMKRAREVKDGTGQAWMDDMPDFELEL